MDRRGVLDQAGMSIPRNHLTEQEIAATYSQKAGWRTIVSVLFPLAREIGRMAKHGSVAQSSRLDKTLDGPTLDVEVGVAGANQ